MKFSKLFVAILATLGIFLASCTPATTQTAKDKATTCLVDFAIASDLDQLKVCVTDVALETGQTEAITYLEGAVDELSAKSVKIVAENFGVNISNTSLEKIREALKAAIREWANELIEQIGLTTANKGAFS